MTNRVAYIKEARAQYNSYDKEWEKSYFDENTGGFIVTKKIRIAQSHRSKNEEVKFKKEYRMCEVLANNGNAIEYLKDKKGSYDIHLNGVKADLKKTGSHNNIVNYAKEAIREQGAEMVIFEFEKETENIYAEIIVLQRKGIRGKYYFTNRKDIVYAI